MNYLNRSWEDGLLNLPERDKDVGEGLNCGESCKHDPVHHPFDLMSKSTYYLLNMIKGFKIKEAYIFGDIFGPHSLERLVCRVQRPQDEP